MVVTKKKKKKNITTGHVFIKTTKKTTNLTRMGMVEIYMKMSKANQSDEACRQEEANYKLLNQASLFKQYKESKSQKVKTEC